MQTLHVHNIPEDLYHQIKSLAQSEQRSLSDQVIFMLNHALKIEQQDQEQTALLQTIRLRRFVPPSDTPNPIDMLRADRAR